MLLDVIIKGEVLVSSCRFLNHKAKWGVVIQSRHDRIKNETLIAEGVSGGISGSS